GETAFKSMTVPYGWAQRPMVQRVGLINPTIQISIICGSRSCIDGQSGHVISEMRPDSQTDVIEVTVQNMSFKPGQTLTVTGVVHDGATNFAINIGTSPEELALHVNPRFEAHGDIRTVVCNSYQGACWCEELRSDSFPFNHGEEFK
ncbi:beta-galactoside-binding lectin-like, partial [Clarias magur]